MGKRCILSGLLLSLMFVWGCNKVANNKKDETGTGQDDHATATDSNDIAVDTNIGHSGDTLIGVASDADTDSDSDTDVDTNADACRVDYMSNSDDYCELYMDCSDSYRFAQCDLWEGGENQCSCDGPNGYFDFELPDGAGNAPCDFVMNICVDIAPENIGEPECDQIREEGAQDYCNITQECTQTVKLTAEITTEARTDNFANCNKDVYYEEGDYENTDDSDWWCDCGGNGKSMSYRVAALADGSAPCGIVFDACQNGTEIVTEGDAKCDITNMYQTPGRSCSIGYTCSQSGLLEGTQVFMNGYLDASCERDGENGWNCHCYGGDKEETFTLTGSNAWTVCEAAGPKCLDLYDPEELVQNNGDVYYEPFFWEKK